MSRTLEHPTLQSLAIRGTPLGSPPPWDLPAVTTLSWRLSREPHDSHALWSAHLPSLRHLDLGLQGVLDLLASNGFLRLLPRLETLRASVTLETASIEPLCQQAPQLAHLRELNLVQFGELFLGEELVELPPEDVFPRAEELVRLERRLRQFLPNLRQPEWKVR
jgi:hypothetical protein